MQRHNGSKLSQVILQGAELLRPPPPAPLITGRTSAASSPRGVPAGSMADEQNPPYMIPILRACSDPRFRRIVVVCGAQMGKTENLLNVLGHRMDDDPVPLLYIGPT